jgi:hypothetical protein
MEVMYRISKRWSAGLADWEYVLEEINEHGTVTKVLSYGNKEWASRHASHYGIKMPKEEK